MSSPYPSEVNLDNLESRVEELEMKIAFQDGTIEELDQQVIKLNQALALQQEQLKLLISKFQSVEPSNMASQADETPPPHY
ncbi:SlyX family protein [Shewanella sp. 0m-4]